MRVDGRVRGRVYDAQGRPARKGVRVTLISPDKAITYKTGYYAPTENEKEHISVETNEQGYYEFKGVPPGKYLLGINLSNQPYRYNPYPQTYFPEGGDARRATVIILTAGQKLSGYDLHLPPRLVERIIKGMVKYQNGSPAIGAEVYVSDAEEFKRAKTDSRGEFEVKCLDGLTYSFQASLRDKDYTLMAESAKVEVKVMKDTPPLLLKFESK
jgi:hypothetical protein